MHKIAYIQKPIEGEKTGRTLIISSTPKKSSGKWKPQQQNEEQGDKVNQQKEYRKRNGLGT